MLAWKWMEIDFKMGFIEYLEFRISKNIKELH